MLYEVITAGSLVTGIFYGFHPGYALGALGVVLGGTLILNFFTVQK